MRSSSALLLSAAAVLLQVSALPVPEELIETGRLSASSSATTADGTYGVERLRDGDRDTHWASSTSGMPQWIRVDWDEPVVLDTVLVNIFARQSHLYASWKTIDVRLSDGAQSTRQLAGSGEESVVLRFEEAHKVTSLEVWVLDVHERRTYVGINELGAYSDPTRRIGPITKTVRPKPFSELSVTGRPDHPTVYVTVADVVRARRNGEQTAWGRSEKANILSQAAQWLEHDDAYWLEFLPPPGACYAYGFTGCPICGSSCGTWGGARCRWDRPFTVECANGHLLPDEGHPDDGSGFVNEDGRIHYILGTWHAWVTEKWTRNAIPCLAHAYALTGDEQYADRAALLLDALASIYAESTAGSWDYPSRPPSGRFARPWYQVARNLVIFVDAYDLIYNSSALTKPSLRPVLESGFAPGPTPQHRTVGTKDTKGMSWPGMSRRENIDRNLMQDAAYYCYAKTFGGALHNGHADYMRGALAVGALLGVPDYVHNAVDSPYSIYAMLANNCDRDGRYYETALGYALHARSLYLTFVEPLRNWRSAQYPDGVDLFADPRMRSFYYMPDLAMSIMGHSPNFGDAGPDNRFAHQPAAPFSSRDYAYAERLYAGCPEPAKTEFGRILSWLAQGDVPRARAASQLKRWLLYHADPVPAASAETLSLPPDLNTRILGSWLLGQKGIAIIRDGEGQDAQGFLLRFGPSLNHGDLDDLGLIYYGKGWQLTYEIGYGLGSTHTQVGWGSQTVSHALTTVNEASQRGGSGGSASLFCSLPSLKLVSADSPLSYASQDVTRYHRTCALIGAGRDQVLIDLFRVHGGNLHDYGIGVQSQTVVANGIELGPETDGSLAGGEHAWGEILGPDGDVIGHPNQPYWNPPPGNGYGFFYDPRQASAREPFTVDFELGGPDTVRFRVHALPDSGTEAILAKAPGLYPSHRKATYLLQRRRAIDGQPLHSVFASVMEPSSQPRAPEGLPFGELLRRIVAQRGEIKPIPSLGLVLLKGTQPGDFVTFAIDVPEDGEYDVSAQLFRSPIYGTVALLVDGEALGRPYDATHAEVQGPGSVTFGSRRLPKGTHQLRFEMQPGTAFAIGVVSLSVAVPIQDEGRPIPTPEPVVSLAERVAVVADDGDAGLAPVGVHVVRKGRDEYLFSASPLGTDVRTATTVAGELQWRGGIVFVACRGDRVETVATHSAWDVRIKGTPYGPDIGVWQTTVAALSYEDRWIEFSPALPQGLRTPCIYFTNPLYSRSTAYRIYGVSNAAGTSRIDLGPQPMLLGRGRIHQITMEGHLLSDIPHDYGRSVVGGSNPRFFDGKRVTNGRGVANHLQRVVFGTPMVLEVTDPTGFAVGDSLYYFDVQVGDRVTIPTAWEGGETATPR